MEQKKVFVVTGSGSHFVKVFAERETALSYMHMWHDNIEHSGLFPSVSRVDAVYSDRIFFTVTDRSGKTIVMQARSEFLY